MRKVITIICCILVLNSCKTLDKSMPKENEIVLNIVGNSEKSVKNKSIEITVYGYDQLLADVSATVIMKKKITLDKLPYKTTLAIPKNPQDIIKPKLSFMENANYYISIKSEDAISINHDKGFPKIDISSKEVQKNYVIVN